MTIKDIAELSGFSKSTVSRVLNNSPKVDKKTREIILKIVNEQNFIPSAMAQGLSKQEANVIGVIIPEAGGSFFGKIVQGIHKELLNTTYTLMLCCTDNTAEYELKALDTLRQQRVSGILLTTSSGFYKNADASKIRQILDQSLIPTVLIDRVIENSMWDGVYSDNKSGAYQITQALVQKKFKKIGAFISDMNLSIGQERYDGFINALQDNNIPINKNIIITEPLQATIKDVYQTTCIMIENGNLPDAIFLSNEIIANGFFKAILEKGICPGKDIHCAGFDYSEILDILNLPFIYLERNTELFGKTAVKLLLNSFNSSHETRNECIIPSKLHLDTSLQNL